MYIDMYVYVCVRIHNVHLCACYSETEGVNINFFMNEYACNYMCVYMYMIDCTRTQTCRDIYTCTC